MKKISFLTLLISISHLITAQVDSINLLYNSIPGIGCHSSMSVCTTTGSLPESGAQITVDWMDGTNDNIVRIVTFSSMIIVKRVSTTHWLPLQAEQLDN
jgi:hypothetical protein